MTDPVSAPVILLPAPVDRRMRLGPFPNASAALKFASFAAGGAVVAALLGPLAWLPFLGGGFLLTAGRGDAKTLDERIGDFVRWQVRRRSAPARRCRPTHRPPGARIARLAGGRHVAALAADGVPVTFLPPGDARSLFDAYRELLRSLEGGLVLRVANEPFPTLPFQLPAAADPVGADAEARNGYDQMVRLLCRRRRRRVVHLILWTDGPSSQDRATLDSRTAALSERLRSFGLEPERLEGEGLVRALARVGWSVEALA